MQLQHHDFASAPRGALDGEPERGVRPPFAKHVLRLLSKVAVAVLVLAPVATLLLPFFAVTALVYGWPPNVPAAELAYSLRLALTAQPPPPGLTVLDRLELLAALLIKCLLIPLLGSAWLLDEVLFGRALDRATIVAPFFEISAARSGSTQISHYLEQDARFVKFNFSQQMFPYLWLWKVAPPLIHRFFSRSQVSAFVLSKFPPEFVARHEVDPYYMDTFEVSFIMSNGLLWGQVGPQGIKDMFSARPVTPLLRAYWRSRFVAHLDRVMRKTLVYNNHGGVADHRRMFVKGHFLAAAPVLEQKYERAAFLTILRHPVPRLRSWANFMNAPEPGIAWNWVSEACVYLETQYCEAEMEFFAAERVGVRGTRRCVICFDDYVNDLRGTMATIYKRLFDADVPASVPREHAKRVRKYALNRTLAQLGISEAQIEADFAEWIAWMRACGAARSGGGTGAGGAKKAR